MAVKRRRDGVGHPDADDAQLETVTGGLDGLEQAYPVVGAVGIVGEHQDHPDRLGVGLPQAVEDRAEGGLERSRPGGMQRVDRRDQARVIHRLVGRDADAARAADDGPRTDSLDSPGTDDTARRGWLWIAAP